MHSNNNQHSHLDKAFTSKHWSWTYLSTFETPRTLYLALCSHLPHIDPISWTSRFALGGIFVNGCPASSIEQLLSTPCRVEYYEPKYNAAEASTFFPSFHSSQIVFEDQHLVVVYKPPGLPTMPARDQNQYSLKAQIESYLGCAVHLPSRLDMSAQGLVILSKSPQTHKGLQQCFENHSIEKTYLLCTASKPNWHKLEVDQAIGKDPRHPVLRCVNGLASKQSFTAFSLLYTYSDGTNLIMAKPRTGRTHQIRVHSAWAGVPIIGDKFYGLIEAPNLCLLSFAVNLFHPLTGNRLKINLPQQFCPTWVSYQHALEASSQS